MPPTRTGFPLDPRVPAVLFESAWWLLAAIALLLLYFPDGRLPGPRWRWVPPVLVGCVAVTQAYGAVDPAAFAAPLEDLARPWGPPPLAVEIVSMVAFGLMLVLFLASGASLVVRYRRARGVARAQLKWLALGGLAAVGVPGGVPGRDRGDRTQRHRGRRCSGSWRSPRSRWPPPSRCSGMTSTTSTRRSRAAVTYGIVTVALVALYTAASLLGGLVLGRGSAVVAAAATAACAVVLAPLRNRLQRAVDRRLYPLRRAGLTAIEALTRRIHGGTARPEDLEATLRTALRDPGLRVGMLVPGEATFVDPTGAPLTGGPLVPVTVGGEQVGALVSSTHTGQPVLREIAAAAGTLVEVARLRAELTRALREVEASRARLVQAGDRERHRLERDLHDGAQQRLVSLGMALRLAQRQLGRGPLEKSPVDVHGLLDQSVAELGTAVAELRQIAHGLRPSSLDDGLPAALDALAQNVTVPIRVEVSTGDLPDDLATTAYFVACEAVTNATKHADAATIAVKVGRQNGHVTVRVEDDGRGGAAPKPGSGLAGLADRVTALGGSLAIHSPGGRGTVIEAELPCGS